MPLLKMRRQEIEGPGQARGTVTRLILTLFPKDVQTTNTPWGLPNLPFQLGGNRVETGQANYKQDKQGLQSLEAAKPELTVATCQDHSNRLHARGLHPSPGPLQAPWS